MTNCLDNKILYKFSKIEYISYLPEDKKSTIVMVGKHGSAKLSWRLFN